GAAIGSTSLTTVSLAEAEKEGSDFAKKVGHPSIAELRKLSTREIYELYNESNRFGFPMVIDGYFLPKSLPERFTAREQAQVPLLVGWNSAERPGTAFMQGQPYTDEAYIAKVKEAYPQKFNEVLKYYP